MSSETAATIGVFDGVHLGHRFLFSQLKAAGGESVIVTFDRPPLEVLRPEMAPAPLLSAEDKASRLASLADRVVMLPFTPELAALTAREFMAQVLRDRLGITHLVMGYDHHFGHPRRDADGRRIPDTLDDYRRWGDEVGITVVQAPPYAGEPASSTLVRQLVTEGRVGDAARLLTQPYALHGTTIPGRQVGRTIGFPTANLHPEGVSARSPRPATGVYITRAILPGLGTFPAVTNIGRRPTLNNGDDITIETFFLLEEGTAPDAATVPGAPDAATVPGVSTPAPLSLSDYRSPWTLEFLDYIRPERAFPDLDALKAQIAADVADARAYYNI